VGLSFDAEREAAAAVGERPPPLRLVVARVAHRLAFPGGALVIGLFARHRDVGIAIAVLVVALMLAASWYTGHGMREEPAETAPAVDVTLADATLPPFRRSFTGYDREQVGEFFTGISLRSPESIEAARFPVKVGGYDQAAVDRSLDAWRLRQAHLTG
jgi:DivIVA domain-containing protein